MAAAAAGGGGGVAAGEYDALGRLTMNALAKKYGEIMSFSADEALELIRNLDINADPEPKPHEGDKEIQGYFYNMFLKLRDKELTPEKYEPLARGTYGTVHTVKNENAKDKVVKEQFKLINADDKPSVKNSKARNFFIEILIQVILSNDLEYGSYIPKIHEAWRADSNKAYVVMDKIDTDLFHKLYKNIVSKGKLINFKSLSSILTAFSELMNGLYRKYRFVHFDFKINNLGEKGDGKPQIFDFGSSCIEFSNLKIRANSIARLAPDIPCNPRSDFALLLISLSLSFYNFMSEQSKQLIDTLLGHKAKRVIEGREVNVSTANLVKAVAEGRRKNKSKPVTGQNTLFAAYNFDGTMFLPDDHLLPANIIKTIREFKERILPKAQNAASAVESRHETQRHRNREKERRSRSRSRNRVVNTRNQNRTRNRPRNH